MVARLHSQKITLYSTYQLAISQEEVGNVFDNITLIDTPISFQTWTNGSNQDERPDELFNNFNALNPFIWLDTYNFELQGSRLTDEYQRFELTLSKWQNSSDSDIIWEDESVIEQAIKSLRIGLYMRDQFLDFNDYDNPIKAYYTDRYEYFGVNGLTNEARFYLHQNEAKLQDKYLLYNEQEEVKEFVSIANHDNLYTNSDDNHVFRIRIQKSEWKLIFERQVYTILDLVGEIGGIYEVLSLLGFAIVNAFTCTAFYYSIFPQLYHVDTLGCQKDHEIQRNYTPYQEKSQNVEETK